MASLVFAGYHGQHIILHAAQFHLYCQNKNVILFPVFNKMASSHWYPTIPTARLSQQKICFKNWLRHVNFWQWKQEAESERTEIISSLTSPTPNKHIRMSGALKASLGNIFTGLTSCLNVSWWCDFGRITVIINLIPKSFCVIKSAVCKWNFKSIFSRFKFQPGKCWIWIDGGEIWIFILKFMLLALFAGHEHSHICNFLTRIISFSYKWKLLIVTAL